MATDVREARSGPTEKHEAIIEAQLDKARKRVRALDLTASLLGFLALALGYAIVAVLLDRIFELGARSRQFALGAFVLGAGAYLWLVVLRPLTWQVNLYYAARQLEKELPGSKNSVVNWVDLRDQKLPGVLRGAVSQRAARDVARADVDRAIGGQRLTYAGLAAATLGLAFAALFFIIGPRPLTSLLSRAFLPFGATGIARSTEIKILRPMPEDAVVPIGSPFTVVADVSGKIPEASDARAPRLRYKHEPNEPWTDRFLQQDETTREWSTTLPPSEVGNGLWYKLEAGEGETAVHQVTLRAPLNVASFLATYTYRPYVGSVPRVSNKRDLTEWVGVSGAELKNWRGTAVELLVTANRPVQGGVLELEVTDGTQFQVPSRRVEGDVRALLFPLVLDRSGKYRIRFTSPEGESYVDPLRYEVVVSPDAAPRARLTEPGKNVELSANDLLRLKAKATDDVGVASLALRMQVVGGAKLPVQPYPSNEKLRLPSGGHVRAVEYQDSVDLGRLGLAVGTEIEYWLEARDACDYPHPNVGESARYRVKLTEPRKDEKARQKEREDAKRQQKEHEKKQDDKLKKEEQQREQERREQEERNKEERNKEERNKPKPGGEEKKEGSGEGSPDKKDGPPKKDKSGEGEQGGDRKGPSKEEKKLQDKANDLDRAAKEREQDQRGSGKGEGEKSPGKGKGSGEKDGEKKPGEARGGEKKGGDDPSGKGKESGAPESKEGASSGKPEGPEGASKEEGPKGAGKEGASPKDQPGRGREGEPAKKERAPEQGKARGTGSAEEKKGAAESKPDGKMGEGAAPSKGKDAGDETKPGEGRQQGAPKEGPEAPPKGAGKAGGEPGAEAPKDAGKGRGKGPEGAEKGKARPAPRKPEPGEGSGRGEAKNDKRPPEPKPPTEAEVKKEIDELSKRLKDKDEKVRRQAEKELAEWEKAYRECKECKAEKEAGKARGNGRGKEPGTPKKKEGESKEGKGTGTGKGKGDEGPPEGKGKEGGPPATDDTVPPGKGKGKTKVSVPGRGPDGERRVGGNPPEPLLPGTQPPAPHRASMIQLEELKKKIDKGLLKDAKMSEEEWRQFLKDYEALARREDARAGREEKLPPSKRGEGLTGMGGKRVRPSGTGRPEDLRNDGRGKAPPGYRDILSEFRRRPAPKE